MERFICKNKEKGFSKQQLLRNYQTLKLVQIVGIDSQT